MTNNHGECSSDTTLENLKCSVQIYWGCTYLRRKSSEGTCFGVVSLAFAEQYSCIDSIAYVCYHQMIYKFLPQNFVFYWTEC